METSALFETRWEMAVASADCTRGVSFAAAVVSTDRSSGLRKAQSNRVTLGGLRRAAFVTNVEPLYGLVCQESVRDLVPFFLALLTLF